MTAVHATADQLAAYGAGRLPVAEAADLEQHLADCQQCLDALAALPDDSLVELLRSPPSLNCAPAITLCQSAARRIPAELQDHPRYHVTEWLGQGGMGVVYKAQHRLMERPVAIKIIRPRLLANPAAADRFRREVKAAARLAHPNIVAAYDAEQAGELHFLVMEYVEGSDLARLVAERGPLPVAEACEYARQAALGLQHAHEHGMILRDCKPGNLIVTPDGQVKILDFGLARFATDVAAASDSAVLDDGVGVPTPEQPATSTGVRLGTTGFMAPEQAADASAADARSDIYSLGCTLYFLLAGRPSFMGSREQQLAAHRDATPTPLTELRPDMPPALAQIVAGMLAKDPAQRPQSATDVAAALAPFAASVGTVRHGWPRRWLAAGVAVLVVAAALAAYGLSSQRQEPRPDADTGATMTTSTTPQATGVHERGRGTDAANVTKITATLPSAEGERVFTGHKAAVVGVGFASDGRRAYSIDRAGSLRTWDTAGDKHAIVALPSEPTFAVAIAESQGRQVALLGGSDATCRLVDMATGKILHRLADGGAGRPGGRERRAVTALALSPDGRRAVAESDDGGLTVWDMAEGRQAGRIWTDSYHAVAVAFMGIDRVAYATRDSNVHVCNLEGGHEEFRLNTKDTYAVALAASPDGGQLVGGLTTGEVVQWDVKERREMRWVRGHGFAPVALAFTPDGMRLLSASGADHVVILWDVASGKQLTRWRSSHGPLSCLAVSRDGLLALAGAGDGSVRLWRLPR